MHIDRKHDNLVFSITVYSQYKNLSIFVINPSHMLILLSQRLLLYCSTSTCTSTTFLAQGQDRTFVDMKMGGHV